MTASSSANHNDNSASSPAQPGARTGLLTAGETPRDAAGAFANVADRLALLGSLALAEERLRETQRVARIGSWELDARTAKFTCSDEMYRILGLDPAHGEPDLDRYLACFYADDIPAHRRAVDQARTGGQSYQLYARIGRDGATARWAHALGQAETDAAGHVIRLYGTVMDIHDRAEAEQRFRVLFDRSSDAHLLLDNDAIIDCNNAALRLMRCSEPSELLSSKFLDLAPDTQPDGQRSADEFAAISATARQSGFHRFEWQCMNVDGQEFTAEVTLTPMTPGPRPVLLAMLHDLTERKRADQQIKDYAIVLEYQNVQLETANTKLAALATTDGLTGLKNRHALEQGLGTEFMLARRFGTPLSLVLLDVDSFKQFNDTFGHPAGDDVLKAVARILRGNARDTDLVARFGGEEFLVVLAETDLDGARRLAERIRGDIETAPWPLRPVTASFGVVELAAGMRGENDLIALADQALYRAKAGGRNQVATHAPAPSAAEETTIAV